MFVLKEKQPIAKKKKNKHKLKHNSVHKPPPPTLLSSLDCFSKQLTDWILEFRPC